MRFCLAQRILILTALTTFCLQVSAQAASASDPVNPSPAEIGEISPLTVDVTPLDSSVAPQAETLLESDNFSANELLTPVPGTTSTSATTLVTQSSLEVAQTPALTQTPPATEQAAVTPRKLSLNGRSYVGVGVNIGVTGDTAIGNTSFAAFSKVALTDFASVRPAMFVTDAVTFLVPLTYDFPLVSAGAIQFNPYVGAGIAISTRNEAVDFIVTGGLDFPITDRLTATAAANFAPAGGLDVGLVFGIAYTFGR
ncbi:hypothetical protein JOY44_02345 [Phormidium sp. CLA17]|uniref:hypothetical protein n=1 Tax=Leptolyngbya sp. Cla-17 TaxID=2803751 RepID=UPI0014921E09|nr:hypothetical protein [Leptolyngbya sp. Cla-17]MBM0740465.1 hypothetical protein [Leptolyngbya sp. Cla-17]